MGTTKAFRMDTSATLVALAEIGFKKKSEESSCKKGGSEKRERTVPFFAQSHF